MFQPPSAGHTHSFLSKAGLTFNALRVDLLDRSGRLLCHFEAVLREVVKEAKLSSRATCWRWKLCTLIIVHTLFITALTSVYMNEHALPCVASMFLCLSPFLLQCLSCHRELFSCPQSQLKRVTSTNTRRRDPSCCLALPSKNATSGWRVRLCLTPKPRIGRLVFRE